MRTAETVLSILRFFDQTSRLRYMRNALRLEPSNPTEQPTRRDAVAASLLFPFRNRNRVTMSGIRFRAVRNGSGARRYLHIHGNEPTARTTLAAHLGRASGVAWIIESDTRLVPFRGGRLDPNRMFSAEGAARNLRRLNPAWSEAQIVNGVLDLDRNRHKLLDVLLPRPGGLLFALHNNGSGYSVRDELAMSNRTAMNQPDRPHEFFLCTDPEDFSRLANSPYNVVLQSNPPPPDDGSLSRLCAKLGVRYLNLETGIGEPTIQAQMLAWADSRLD